MFTRIQAMKAALTHNWQTLAELRVKANATQGRDPWDTSGSGAMQAHLVLMKQDGLVEQAEHPDTGARVWRLVVRGRRVCPDCQGRGYLVRRSGNVLDGLPRCGKCSGTGDVHDASSPE